MRKWRIKSRKILATLLAAVMLLVMIPTTLVDTAAADMTYVEQDGWFYFWDEQGLKDILTANADSDWIPMRFAASQSELDDSTGTMTLNSSMTIPASAYVHMRDGQLKVAALKKLTVQGTLVTRVDRAVTGSVSVEGNGVYCKYSDVTDGASLVSELKKLGDMAAAGDVAKDLEVSVMADVTVNGDLTVPAGVYMYLDEGKALQVSGALTVKKGATIGNSGVLKAASVNIEQGGSMSYGEGAELDYGSQLTVNGEFYGFGTVRGTGSQPSIVIGGTAEITNYGAGSISADVWSVNAAATINNYGVLVVPLAQRANLISGTNISYGAKDEDNGGTGSVQYAVRLTDTEAGKAGVLQNAINTFDTITDKKDYELFAVSVSNAAKGQPMQLTLNENVTLDGAADCLFLTQNDWPEDETGFAPHVTIGEGAALTVAAGRTLSANVPVTVNGTLDIRSEGSFTFGTPGIVVLQDGMTVNGTVLTAGLLEVSGDVAVAEGGVLHQTMGSVRIEGSLTVNGTMIVDMVDFQIKGSYTKGANATVTIGENANFSYQAKTEFNKAAILAAFAQENVSTVTVEVNEDVTMTEDLTIPKGKTLVIDGYETLTIAPGVTLALEGTVEADWEKNIDGGQLKCGAPMVIRGTFSVGTRAYANPYTTITVENGGSLVMNGSSYFAGHSFTVKSGGRVINNSRMAFGTGNTITVEDGWDSAWTQGPNATAEVNRGIYLYSNDNAAAAIQTAIAEVTGSLPEFFSYVVYVYREDNGERIELTRDVTIPTGVMLAFYNEGVTTCIAEGAALTIQGILYSEAPITVDGKLTVSANGYANVQKNLLVGGTLTIDEGGRMYCQYLTDENEQGKAGTIVNNGSLAAEQTELKHNEVDIGDDSGNRVVGTFEALKSALTKGGQINYRGSELTISEDLTIPENVDLTINVTTFTVSEGVTLTNRGNVTVFGDMYLYGKLDVSGETGGFRGYGMIMEGDESSIIGEYGGRRFRWTMRVTKSGETEILTAEELTAMFDAPLVSAIELRLGRQTTLTLNGDIAINDKQLNISGGQYSNVVINGKLSVWRYMYISTTMTVNGTVEVYANLVMRGNMTINNGGNLHVRIYLDKDTYRQWIGSVEFAEGFRINLPEGATMGDYVTVDQGCTVGVRKYVAASELEGTLRNCADGQYYIIQVSNDQSQSEKWPLHIAAGTTVTIPENVTVQIPDYNIGGFSEFVIGAADENGTKGELVVNGRLEVDVPARVEGTLTVNGSARFGNGYEVRANGAMLVNAGGEMVITGKLTGTGTITNNGTLTANEKAMGTVIGGSGKTMIGNTRLEASNMAELKTALSSLSGSAERQTIYLCRSAMDDANPYFVIDGDITVPSGVELRMDEMRSSNFRGLTVAENAKLTVAGAVYTWAEDGVTVNGTLETLHGGQDENGNWISNGRVVAYSVTVASTGRLVNGGGLDVNDRDEQTGGMLAVEGVLENSNTVNCRDLRYSGTALTNKGNIYVRQQLKIAEGCVIENAGQVTYADCDALDKISNSENASIRWEKTTNTVEELRALMTRTENGTATLELREDCTLNEELTIPENIELVLAAEYERTSTLTVPEGVTLSANGQLNIKDSATLAVNGTLATSNDVQVYGALLISESGVWQQENWASVSNDGASITINGRLEQSESWVELTSRWNGKIIFGANAHWNEVGTISSRESSTAITGFDTGKYKLSTNDGINYYLERLSGGGSSSGGETSTIGDVNGDGVVDQADLVALARFMAGIDDLEDTTRADINGDGIYSAADLTALARMLEAQPGTQTADADENGAPVDTGAELNADAQDTVQTEDGGAPVEPAPAADDVPETVEEPVTGEVPQTEAGEQAA